MNNKQYETISFGFFLLFVGTIALLSNIGLISWSLLLDFVFKYWPAFIIVTGIKIVGDAQLGKFFGLVVDVLFFAAVILGLVFAKDMLFPPVSELPAQGITREILFSEYPETIVANYDLTFGAAEFSVTDAVSSRYIIVDGSKDFDLSSEQSENKSLTISLVNKPLDRLHRLPSFRNLSKYQISLGVTETPSAMIVTAGASDGYVNLDEQKLTSFTSKVGAGNLVVALANSSVPKKISLDVGAGKTTLKLPANIKVRITYALGAGSLKFTSVTGNIDKEFGGIGANGVYEMSPLPDLEISVNLGAGAVEIQQDKFSVQRAEMSVEIVM